MAQILKALTMVNVVCIDTNGEIGTGGFSSLISAVFIFLLFPIFFVRHLTIPRPQETGELIESYMLIRELVPRISYGRGLEFVCGSVEETVTL